ncbi:inositol monophosphatase family protein [Leptospira sp. GIMC2001]|uniref:inositol monophosphatase family protein n=1 Tax=Leptospira sp. GIMC2001 TaxID=1513297 RepID=UPI00234A9F88|nr:inositol monophosphatase family protein [Leptospira sp. GIMC2001]WCL49578.1 inositol monophosphatase family protein [Leptospira sp. GIMC2001]
MNQEINDRYNELSQFIFKVGEFLEFTHKKVNLEIQNKGTFDLVTEADIESEKMVIHTILSHFPQDSILGEESGEVRGNSDFRWIIDPLDGTTNYSHNLPLYGVSIALEKISSSEIVVGLVLFPELGDFYSAVRGQGSYKNKNKITVSKTTEFKNALFCTGFPYDRAEKIDMLMSYYKNILIKSRGIRRTGAATLDLCWTAEGRFDGYYEIGLKPWDMAAAGLIVTEAGGKLSTMDGREYSPYTSNLIASNGILHENLLKEFTQ